ncbi:MAG: ATP-dependent DNA helicase [Propionibacterium freudenreichii]
MFSSELLLAAENRLLERVRTTTGPTVPLATVERITGRPDRGGRTLGPDQAGALAKIALSGRMVDVLVGPAGAGKTTAMNALRRAWEIEHGAGSVVGLAPSAVAAQVLADDLAIATENTAKWLDTHDRTGQLVIVDEASLAGTLSLDRITALAAGAGAKVLLVGDYAQLQSPTAAGAFALFVHDRGDAPELVSLHRFTHAWEKAASLGLRHGDLAVIDTYAGHGRLREGETEEMQEAAYQGWRADILASRSSILVPDSGESVLALNQRARAELILDGTVNARREVELHDGTRAAAGDTVITRKNDRRLRSGRSWVRNGNRWTVTAVRDDGSLTLRPQGRRWGGSVVIPADYAATNVELGYAVTAIRAEGVTVDTSHVLAGTGTTRENFYVAMTRGAETNTAYLSTDCPDAAHEGPRSDATGRTVMAGILGHVGAELSAHETMTAEQDAWGSIAQLAAEYETLAAAAQHDRWALLVRGSGLSDDEADDAIASPAFGALTAELRRAEANQHDIETLLPRLVRAHGFGDADDIAAVLHYRLTRATARPAGSGRARKTPRLIAGLIPEATGTMTREMRQALNERRDLIEARATALLASALAGAESRTTGLGTPPKGSKEAAEWQRAVRVVVAYRDRYGITDPDPLGSAPEGDAQKIDAARARVALNRARGFSNVDSGEPGRTPQSGAQRAGPVL